MEKIPVRQFTTVCEVCGKQFESNRESEDLCLVHRVLYDLKLSEDTIINMNIVKLWQAGRYDKVTGIDPMLAKISEGAIILKGEESLESRDIYTTLSVCNSDVTSELIEGYVSLLMKHKNVAFDILVVVRYSQRSNFHVYGLRFSKRMATKLSKKPVLFRKKYAISLVNKHFLKKLKK